MDTTTEVDLKQIPEMFATRFPEEMKPELAALMALEKRKLTPLCMLLISEGMKVKKAVHAHRNTLIDVVLDAGQTLRFKRTPFDPNREYKESPGLLIEIDNGVKSPPEFILLSKEKALSLAANLSIFLNEVNL